MNTPLPPPALPPETVERILHVAKYGYCSTVAEIARKANVDFMDAVRVIFPPKNPSPQRD
jgi:hypothetical protein